MDPIPMDPMQIQQLQFIHNEPLEDGLILTGRFKLVRKDNPNKPNAVPWLDTAG